MACTGRPAHLAIAWLGRERLPRLIAGLAALGLALVLGGVLWALARTAATGAGSATAGSVPTATHDATRAAIDAWETLWEQIDTQGVAALRPETSDPSLRAAGDTAFMRYRDLWAPLDNPADQLAFQLAALSSDPARKGALIQPLTESATPLIRFRAQLELARLARRGEDLPRAQAAAHAALAVAAVPERARADAWFILGDIAREQHRLADAETALDAAIAADPGFWDARRLRLDVLAQQLARPRQHQAACLDRTRRMIEDLGALPALAEDQTQFRDLADRFARTDTPPHVALVLIAGLGYHWSGASERARAVLAEAERRRGRLPRACERLILERIAALDQSP
jgi:tetratricopeptide (TPR) repeat protein